MYFVNDTLCDRSTLINKWLLTPTDNNLLRTQAPQLYTITFYFFIHYKTLSSISPFPSMIISLFSLLGKGPSENCIVYAAEGGEKNPPNLKTAQSIT